MEYIFGTVEKNGKTVENLKTVDTQHSTLTGFVQTERTYDDSIITDHFHIVEKYRSQNDDAGNCYEWYVIDQHYRYVDKFTPVQAEFTKLRDTSSIAFVALSEAGTIDAVTAGEHADEFSPWAENVAYAIGNLRKYTDGKLYRCIQAHTSQSDWTPDTAVSLWAKAADPAEAWPEWSQPVGATDAYAVGAHVSHKGGHWESTAAANVWEPGVYGWKAV